MKRACFTKTEGFNGVWGDSAPCRPAPEALQRPVSRELTPNHAQKDIRALKPVCRGLRHASSGGVPACGVHLLDACRGAFRKLAVLVPLQVSLTHETSWKST